MKWNRHDPTILASTHEGNIKIWVGGPGVGAGLEAAASPTNPRLGTAQDMRQGAPRNHITGYMARIFGLDWSYVNAEELVTAAPSAQDASVSTCSAGSLCCCDTLIPGFQLACRSSSGTATLGSSSAQSAEVSTFFLLCTSHAREATTPSSHFQHPTPFWFFCRPCVSRAVHALWPRYRH